MTVLTSNDLIKQFMLINQLANFHKLEIDPFLWFVKILLTSFKYSLLCKIHNLNYETVVYCGV